MSEPYDGRLGDYISEELSRKLGELSSELRRLGLVGDRLPY